jgi:hypothetical protein
MDNSFHGKMPVALKYLGFSRREMAVHALSLMHIRKLFVRILFQIFDQEPIFSRFKYKIIVFSIDDKGGDMSCILFTNFADTWESLQIVTCANISWAPEPLRDSFYCY